MGIVKLSKTGFTGATYLKSDSFLVGNTAFSPARGLFAGGSNGSSLNVIDYIAIDTTGNATDFGDLSTGLDALASCASSTRGIFASGSPATSAISYVTILTTGNTTSFGALTVNAYTGSGVNNSTRGVFAIGQQDSAPSGRSNKLEYITIATTGNSTSFGTLTVARAALGAVCDTTRGVFIGGLSGTTTIDYITTATTGNATSFGTLASGITYVAGASNSTRGLFGQDQAVRYITIATTGDSDAFGNLIQASYYYYAGYFCYACFFIIRLVIMPYNNYAYYYAYDYYYASHYVILPFYCGFYL
jgi:hypothetical protein